MANLIKLKDCRVEIPARSFVYSITPPISKLQAGLEAFEALRRGHAAHRLSLSEREETARFLLQFGRLLYDTLFPASQESMLDSDEPMWIAPMGEWGAYPWELLHDGRRWVSIHQGVFRTTWPPPTDIEPARLFSAPVRVLALNARPISLEGVEDTQEPGWFERFVSDVALLGDNIPSSPLPVHYRILPHATISALDSGMAAGPDVLMFSGRATAEGWWLETDRGAPELLKWDDLLHRLKQASERGLRLVVLKDTLGFGQPLTQSARATELQRAGMPTVIRLDGLQSRRREQDYLRTLLVHLSEGITVIEAHRRSLRVLFEPLETEWGWVFPRVYEPVPSPSLRREAPRLSSENVRSEAGGDGSAMTLFVTPPAPPFLRPRRRSFDRSSVTKQLVASLQPDATGSSPLVYLHGARGSGKTTVALAAAQRVRRRFSQVLYLSPRLLLPDPWQVADPRGVPREDDNPTDRMLAAVAHHLGEPDRVDNTGLDWPARLRRLLEHGAGSLLILDRLESLPGYGELCEALAELPQRSKVLLIGRQPPPLLPGATVNLPPLTREELAQIFGADLPDRLDRADPSGRLLDGCRVDLFLARLLRGEAPIPPMGEWFARDAALDEKRADEVGAAGEDVVPPPPEVVLRQAEHALKGFSHAHQRVLQALALPPGALHRDAVTALAGLPGEAVRPALIDLQRLGWVDAYSGERYVMLSARLHQWASERLLTTEALERMQKTWLRGTSNFLSALSVAIDENPAFWGKGGPPLLAWSDEHCEMSPPAHVRLAHRLGVERTQIVDLIWMLGAGKDWKTLERLAEAIEPLSRMRETRDVWRMVNLALLAGAEARSDSLAQAQALNRLAVPLLEQRKAPQARPLLERALDLLGSTPGWSVLGETYRLLSRCYEQLGRLDSAVNLLHSAVALAGQLELPEDIPPAGEALARLWLRKGEEPSEARGYLEKQIQILRDGGHDIPAAAVMRVLADYLIRTGGAEEGLTLYTEALDLCRGSGADSEAATTLLRLADGHLRRGEGDRALELLTQAEDEMGGGLVDPEEQGRILTGICRIFEQRNLPERALEGYLRIKTLLEGMGDRVALIGVLDRIGGLYYRLNEQEKATQCYEERLHLQDTVTPS